ncbi:hypothetical protein SCOR_00520 [Sulfidibacter corallicola]
MRRWMKFAILALLALIGLGIAAAAVLWAAFPRSIPAPESRVEGDPAQLARGRYLVNHVALCLSCHSERDWDRQSGPVVASTAGQGATHTIFSPEDAPAANITPFALGDWSDGEIARAITSGLNRQGEPLHPDMPYYVYARLAESDVMAIVAYLRTLPSIDHQPPKASPPFLISMVGRVLPKPYQAKPMPPQDDSVARGRYLVNAAGCRMCHGGDLAGGMRLNIPGGGSVTSVNLTPHPKARVMGWSREAFVAAFKAFAVEEVRQLETPRDRNTVMPWIQYSDMTETDLGAIYDFLKTVPPVAPDS